MTEVAFLLQGLKDHCHGVDVRTRLIVEGLHLLWSARSELPNQRHHLFFLLCEFRQCSHFIRYYLRVSTINLDEIRGKYGDIWRYAQINPIYLT